MVRRLMVSSAFVLACSSPAFAQDPVVGVNVGGFFLKGADARGDNDLLTEYLPLLEFDVSDFNGLTAGGDFNVSLGSFVEVGAGVNFYRRTVPVVYSDFLDDDLSEIESDLRLRNVPVSLTAKVFPLTRDAAVQPYVGGGVQFNFWRYSETGEFLDDDLNIREDSFADDGLEVGPVILAGVRFPVGTNALLGGEWRYSRAKAALDPELFFGNDFDLGGNTFLFTLNFRLR